MGRIQRAREKKTVSRRGGEWEDNKHHKLILECTASRIRQIRV